MKKRENKTHLNWALGIKTLLEQSGFAFMWELGPVMGETAFLRILRQRMRDNFMQSWHEKNGQNNRYVTYNSFKPDFGSEAYLVDLNIAMRVTPCHQLYFPTLD